MRSESWNLKTTSEWQHKMLKCVRYREEVSELTVEELLQLALVQFVFIPIISWVVVENCYQRVHRALELTRHSAGRTLCGFLEMKMLYYFLTQERDVTTGENFLTCLESHTNVSRRRSTACLLANEEKLSWPSCSFVGIINSTGEMSMVTVFLSRS